MKMICSKAKRHVALTISLLAIGGCLTPENNFSGTGEVSAGTSANAAPTISGAPPLTAKIGAFYTFTPTASDPDGDNLLFSITNMPNWCDFDPNSGTLSGTPTLGDTRLHQGIVISVSDGNAERSLPAFNIDVTDIGTFSVTLSWTAPTENVDNSPLLDLSGYKVYYGLSENSFSNEIFINTAGLTSYTVENLTANTYYFVVTAINRSGAESSFSNPVSWVAQ